MLILITQERLAKLLKDEITCSVYREHAGRPEDPLGTSALAEFYAALRKTDETALQGQGCGPAFQLVWRPGGKDSTVLMAEQEGKEARLLSVEPDDKGTFRSGPDVSDVSPVFVCLSAKEVTAEARRILFWFGAGIPDFVHREPIRGTDRFGTGWELVDREGGPVRSYTKAASGRGAVNTIKGGSCPHKIGSEGKVWTEGCEYYPSVFGMKWRKVADVG